MVSLQYTVCCSIQNFYPDQKIFKNKITIFLICCDSSKSQTNEGKYLLSNSIHEFTNKNEKTKTDEKESDY